MKYLTIVMLTACLGACSKSPDATSPGTTSPAPVAETTPATSTPEKEGLTLSSARTLWLQSAQGKDYEYTLSMEYGGANEPSVYSVKVVGGSSTSNLPAPAGSTPPLGTIEGMFEYLTELEKDPNMKLTITFDPTYGYPVQFDLAVPQNIHETTSNKIKDFKFLPAN
jgi:Family of unknown function (DUF6174)